MGAPANEITVHAFDDVSFAEAMAKASNGSERVIFPQLRYLARYAKSLGAKTVVREEHYIDRHYLDEFAQYYSRALRPVQNAVRRFHVFGESFSQEKFETWLAESGTAEGSRAEIEKALTGHYLGFVSVRPMSAVPIGRTVLRRLKGPREIWAIGPQDVHLANLELHVEGLPFQQQDSAVGACATAALWSALSRVARLEGMRAPTPAEISEMAGSRVLTHGRVVPSSGLTMWQLAEAIRCAGFAPEAVSASKPEYFAIALHTYLLSGIPVVLGLERGSSGHAVTAAGFRCEGPPAKLLEASVPVRSASIKKLYVHDDRLGPYARAPLEAFEVPNPLSIKAASIQGLALHLDDGPWSITAGLVPVYPKLRLSVRSLLLLADLTSRWLDDMTVDALGSDAVHQLSVEFFYKRSGAYLASLSGRVAGDVATFMKTVALSRWCGVIRWHYADLAIAEFVFDTTDVVREGRSLGVELLRAIACLDARFATGLGVVGAALRVPTV
jgi:hypothetical protein